MDKMRDYAESARNCIGRWQGRWTLCRTLDAEKDSGENSEYRAGLRSVQKTQDARRWTVTARRTGHRRLDRILRMLNIIEDSGVCTGSKRLHKTLR